MTNPGGSSDLIGDFQRWLLRSGARGMSRELADQVRAALGKNQSTGDVWETATTQPVPADAPECAWCPLCRAARIVREAKPGRDKRVAAVGDALTTVVQDAVSVLEAALAATGRSGKRPGGVGGPGTRGYPAAGTAAEAAPGPAGRRHRAPAGRQHRVPAGRQRRAPARRQRRAPAGRQRPGPDAAPAAAQAPTRRQRRAGRSGGTGHGSARGAGTSGRIPA